MRRLARIEALLDGPIAEANEAALQGLVDSAITEDTDLEYKSELYGGSDGAKRDLAGDIAALANAIGGLLILGIQDEQGAAAELTPVPLSDAEELRMRQVVAAKVAPHPAIIFHHVLAEGDPDRGYYLIEVPRSPLRPHAVRVNEALRYAKRDGPGIRWLSESEVADAYRNRFLSAETEARRVADVRRQGEAALPELGEYAWLSVALTPSLPGEMQLTYRRVEEFHRFNRATDAPRLTTSRLLESAPTVEAGHRRVVVMLNQDNRGQPIDGLLHLHTDGSGYAAVPVGREARNQATREKLGFAPIYDEPLTQEVTAAVALLTRHAVWNCGTGGEGLIEGTIITRMPLQLAHGRGAPGDGWNARLVDAPPVGQHTIELDEVTGSPRGLVIASRMLLNDIVQGFGVAESPQLTAVGALRRPYFSQGVLPQVEREAERLDLELVDEGL